MEKYGELDYAKLDFDKGKPTVIRRRFFVKEKRLLSCEGFSGLFGMKKSTFWVRGHQENSMKI